MDPSNSECLDDLLYIDLVIIIIQLFSFLLIMVQWVAKFYGILFYFIIRYPVHEIHLKLSHGNRIFFQALELEGRMGLSPRLVVLLEIL